MVSLALLWSDYSGLLAIMSLALMSTVSLDQFSLLRGKLKPVKGIRDMNRSTTGSFSSQPIRQLLKYQISGETITESRFLNGAEKVGSLRFLYYNLCSTIIWLSVLLTAGIFLRAVLIHVIGRFGPVEFEAIIGILAVYVTGLTVVLIYNHRNPKSRM